MLQPALAHKTVGPPPVLQCDGVTDNVAALNDGLAQGGIVTLPTGVCMTSGIVMVPRGTTLVGAGEGATTIRAFAGIQTPTLQIMGTANVSNLTVDGGATQTFYGAPAIHVDPGSDGTVIHDLEALNAGDEGISVESSHVQVLRTDSHDNWKSGIYVMGDALTGLRIYGVSVVSNTLSNNVRGLSLQGQPGDGIDIDTLTRDVTVQDNTVYDNDIILTEPGLIPDSQGGTVATGHVVTGNQVISSQKGGVSVESYVNDFTISDNTVTNAVGLGIFVHGPATSGKVLANTVNASTSNGITVASIPGSAPPDGMLVNGNTVEGLAAEVASIVVSGGATNVTVTGNTVSTPIKTVGAGLGLVVKGND